MDEQMNDIELVIPCSESGVSDQSMYFREQGPDGKRQVDLVLAYEIPTTKRMKELKDDERKKEDIKALKRREFESNLRKAGVQLEHENAVAEKNKIEIQYVKLHGPWETLCECAEEILMKLPIKKYDIDLQPWYQKLLGKTLLEKLAKLNPFIIADSSIPERERYYVAYFKKEYLSEFIGHENKSTFFPQPERSRMIEHICDQTRFGEGRFDIDIKRLLFQGVYTACYPLHSGSERLLEGTRPTNGRQRLKREWARFSRIFKYQPHHAIKEYFGTEVGLYFAWLGFYTAMLIPAAIVGLLVFIIGIGAAIKFPPVLDACSEKNRALFTMCPLCDRECDYWSLADFCLYIRLVYMFDNDATVFLAIFMSVWATLFLEFWKRQQAILSYEWHMMHFEEMEEQLRPEFVATATTLKENPVTGKMEPYIPAKQRYQRFAGAASAITFMIFLVFGAVAGVVVYRAAVFGAMMASPSNELHKRAKIATSASAAVLNLICINILKYFYEKLAIKLTEWENPRTRTAYEDSFTYKMFLFQSVNTYSSIFYIAFFKLNLIIGTPGNYRRIGPGYRMDGCSAGGCLFDLCIQLVVIMVGQQIVGNITEVGIPAVKKWWNLRQAQRDKEVTNPLPQWELDYNLEALPEHHMFWEYLEVVLQFGFVTMFVSAFPLAPLFALLNSVCELRVDAINFVDQFRRPTPTRAQDIGAWYPIMEALVSISVLVNAFVLAFTSDFIPRLVYKTHYGKEGSLEGYLNNSLSFFDVDNFTSDEKPISSLPFTNLSYCRYPGYFKPHYPYKVSEQYWHVIAARLGFVFVFQYLVYAITKLVAYIVPDRPKFLELQIQREAHLEKQALHQTLQENESKVETDREVSV